MNKNRKSDLSNQNKKSFLRNLRRSIRKYSTSPNPEKADKIFKINDLVDLRLKNNKTFIYVNNKKFFQCLNVLLNIGAEKHKKNIKNMDEAFRLSRGRYSQWFAKISPEEEFMAHCSNIQAFFENELNTDILHTDIAFPLLKKLVSLDYKPAMKVFKKEIIKRFNEGTWETQRFLKSEGYLKYLNRDDTHTLKESSAFKKYMELSYPIRKYLEGEKKTIGINKAKSIRIFEYNDTECQFYEIYKTFPLYTLLDSNKILLFDNPLLKIVWVWHGFDTTTRMKFYAKKLLQNILKRYGLGFKVNYIDEGFEPIEFEEMIKAPEEPKYGGIKDGIKDFEPLSEQKISSLIEKLHLSEISAKESEIGSGQSDLGEIIKSFLGIDTSKKKAKDFDFFFDLIEKDIKKIEVIMREQSTKELIIHRKYLPEIFNRDLLIIAKIDGYPLFIPGVTNCFELMGILTLISGNIIKFLKFNQD